MRRAILIDLEGTLCEEPGDFPSAERVRLLEGGAAAIRLANEAGFQTVAVANQGAVARGDSPEEVVGQVHDRIRELLAEHGSRLDGIYYCPHDPDAGLGKYRRDCECRKPGTGLLLRAREEMGIDLHSSYVIGDSSEDLEAGRRVGATTILVLTGRGREGREQRSAGRPTPDHIASDMLEAVQWILTREQRRPAQASPLHPGPESCQP